MHMIKRKKFRLPGYKYLKKLPFYKLIENFLKYSFVSLILTAVSIIIMWLAVDLFGVLAAVMSPILYIAALFTKYFVYKRIDLTKMKKHVAAIYAFIELVILGISIFAFWAVIDVGKFNTLLFTPIIWTSVFFLRFGFYSWFNMLRTSKHPFRHKQHYEK